MIFEKRMYCVLEPNFSYELLFHFKMSFKYGKKQKAIHCIIMQLIYSIHVTPRKNHYCDIIKNSWLLKELKSTNEELEEIFILR